MPLDPSDIGFRERLAYLRWLRNRGRVRAETDAQFATALGLERGWVEKWKRRSDAPPGHKERRALETMLTPLDSSTDWLYEGSGHPPERAQWQLWLADWRTSTERLSDADVGQTVASESDASFAARTGLHARQRKPVSEIVVSKTEKATPKKGRRKLSGGG